MPLMHFLNSASSVDVSSEAAANAEVTLTDALGYSGLGVGIVFAVLVVLMAFIALMSALLRGSDKPKAAPAPKAEKPAPAPAPVSKVEESVPVSAPDGAMYVTLDGKKHTVTVVEKVPQFTVKLGGKVHSVDVEPVEEVAE